MKRGKIKCLVYVVETTPGLTREHLLTGAVHVTAATVAYEYQQD